jgi:ribosomal protein S18 acetylase RimI-like enzyme
MEGSAGTDTALRLAYRPATRDDNHAIAKYICIAGGGLYEFLFDDLIPFLSAADFMAGGVASERYPVSYRNCHVAVDAASGEILGAANVFPADELKHERYEMLPSGRQEHVRSMLQLQDWGSMFLNALAVSDRCRGMGVGSRLLDWAEARAREGGFDRLSLHVWADNVSAVAFYKTRGFVVLHVAAVEPHPRLPRVGGSILMRKAIAPR